MLLQKSLVPYAVSILAIAAAIGIRLLLDPLIGARNPFFTVFLAVVFMAWWGGSGPAWLTSIVGAIAAIFFLLEPRHTFAIYQLEHQIALLLFGIVCFATITLFGTLRKAKERAAESSEWLRATLASIGDGVITIDKESLITSMNTVAATLTGWTSNDAQGQWLHKVFRIVNESTREPVENPALRALKEGGIVGLANHTILIAKDGTERSIDDSAAPIRNKEGDVVGCVLVFRDITERRQLERQASERAAAARLLASVVESSEDAIISKSIDGFIQSWNVSAQRLFGYSAEQAIGQNISLLIPADRAEEETQILTQLRAGKRIEAYDTVRVRSDGRPVHVSLTISPIRDEEGRVIGASKIVRDITERKKAEEALRRSERELSDFFENASIGLHWVGPDGIILRVNQTELNLLGYREEEYVGRHIAEFHVDQPVIEDILARLTRGETVEECPARLRCKDGSIVDVAINSSVLFESGQFIHTRCFTRDISQQRQAELALRNNEQQLQLITDATPGLIAFIDRDMRYRFVNRQYETWFGYHREELIGMSVTEVLGSAAMAQLKPHMERALLGEEAQFEAEIPYRQGGVRWIDARYVPHRNGDGMISGFFVLVLDITERHRAETETLKAQQLLAVTLESVTDGFMRYDRNWRIVYVNSEAEHINRLSREQMLGKTPWQLFPDVVGTKLETEYRRAMTEQVTVEFENYYQPFDRWYSLKLYPTADGGLTSFIRDISEQKRAEDQLRRSTELLTVVIDRSPSGFYIVDSQFCISHMNADSQARAFRNVNPAIGRRLDDAMRVLWPEPLASEIIAIFRHTLESGEPYRSPGLVSPRADLENVESYEWQLDRITMPDGSFAVVCYYYDTTRLREAEAEARENAEGLRKLTAELSDASRRKDEFLATLAHELRNPLAPVMNSLGMMKHAISAQQLEQARTTMERQVGQMVRLIDDLLDVSRITRDKLLLKTERVELASIVHHVLEACKPLYQSAGHTLSVTLPAEPIYLNADPTRLAQVFGNLLNNSCKYSERNSNVWFTAQRQEDHVIIRIKDTGIGIPQDMLPKVFDLFTQVHGSMDRSEGGLGIGLSLVKRLVEMHGGTVTANSDGPGKGSEFVVTLPILTTAAPASVVNEPISQPRTSQMRRILVVDDNRDSAESLALLLGLTGNETQTAHDGMEAVQKAESYRPELILLDIGLPKMNGYEACRAIRQQEWGRDIVIIALTGWGQDEDRRKSKEAGFNGHLVKPVELSQLEKLLAELKKSP